MESTSDAELETTAALEATSAAEGGSTTLSSTCETSSATAAAASTTASSAVGGARCGHLFCPWEAGTCCTSRVPDGLPWAPHANRQYGVCGGPNAVCCGLLVCAPGSVCCKGRYCAARQADCSED